jgi:hypothetical protein
MVIYGDELHTLWLVVLLVRLSGYLLSVARPGTRSKHAIHPTDWGIRPTYNTGNKK